MIPESFMRKEFELIAGETKTCWRRHPNLSWDWARRRDEEEKLQSILRLENFKISKIQKLGVRLS